MKHLAILFVITFFSFSQNQNENAIMISCHKLTVEHSADSIKTLINQGKLAFINIGINPNIPDEYHALRKKYNVGYVSENCATDPISMQQAITNNQVLAVYLIKLYGTAWLENLNYKPLGVELPR